MPYAELGGLRLYYERAGSFDPELLFVHGWCCDHTAFRPQFDHFAQTHAVTGLDLRGCGRSDRPTEGYDIPDFSDDLARFCAAVGIAKPVVVGHSLGGMIAVELAAQQPSIARALILLDPGPIHPLPRTVEFFRSFAEELAGPGGEDIRRAYVQDMGARDEELAHWIANASFYNRTGFPAHDFAERWRRGEIEDTSENASLLIEALSIREALDRAGIGNEVLA